MFGKATLFRFIGVYTFREAYSVGSIFSHKAKAHLNSGFHQDIRRGLGLSSLLTMPRLCHTKWDCPAIEELLQQNERWAICTYATTGKKQNPDNFCLLSLAIFHGYLVISSCCQARGWAACPSPNSRSLFTSVHKVTYKPLWLVWIIEISLHNRLLCPLGLLRANAEDRLVIGQHCRLPGNCKSWAAKHAETRKNRG